MSFSHLVGNDTAKHRLEKMLAAQQVPSVLLFAGPSGVGKKQYALALAAELLGPKSHAKLKAGTHPDLHFLVPTGKSYTHSVDAIRKLIDEAALPPYEASVKVFLIEDAHQMMPVSSNALLKVLEEPFLHSYFILLTESVESLLPTIVSRARTLSFFPVAQGDVERFVENHLHKKATEARKIAFLAHGSLSRATQLAAHIEMPWKDPLFQLLSLDLPGDYLQCVRLCEEIETSFLPVSSTEQEESMGVPMDQLLEEVVMWYRDLHLLKEGVAIEHLYHLDRLPSLQSALAGRVPILEKVLTQIDLARLALQRNLRMRHVLEHFMLNLI